MMKQTLPPQGGVIVPAADLFLHRTATGFAVRPSSSTPGVRRGRRAAGIGRPGGWAPLVSAMTFSRAPVVTCAARRSAEAKMLPMLEKD